jgi:hypothetical protein
MTPLLLTALLIFAHKQQLETLHPMDLTGPFWLRKETLELLELLARRDQLATQA